MAKLKYTFDNYINNPSGKGSAVTTSINKDTYNAELLSLESKNDKVKYTVYKQSYHHYKRILQYISLLSYQI